MKHLLKGQAGLGWFHFLLPAIQLTYPFFHFHFLKGEIPFIRNPTGSNPFFINRSKTFGS